MAFRRIVSFLMVAIFWGAAGQAAEPSPFQVHEIRDRVYVLTRLWESDVGNNMGVVVGDDGLLLINSMMASDSEALMRVLKHLSDKPVKYVLNSNWDPYNTQGNAYFAARGATVIAQENVIFAPRDASYRPTFHQILFKGQLTLRFGGETIHLTRSGGHSFGHVNIRLEKANMVFMADSFRPDRPGTMGPNGLKGHLAGLEQALQGSDDSTYFISGSYAGKLLNRRADLMRAKAFRKQFLGRIGALVARGKTAADIAGDSEITRLLRVAYPAMKKAGREISPEEISAILSTEFVTEFPMDKAQRGMYTGRYQGPGGVMLEIYEDEKTLRARALGRFMVALKPLSADAFAFADVENGEKIIFQRNGEGRVTGLRPEMGESYYARRIPSGVWRKL